MLKISLATPPPPVTDTNVLARALQQISDYTQKFSAEHARAEKLAGENLEWQKKFSQTAGEKPATLQTLQVENEKMRVQIADLHDALATAPNVKKLSADLKAAHRQIADLQSAAADDAKHLRKLTTERDELQAKLETASRKFENQTTAAMKSARSEIADLQAAVADREQRLKKLTQAQDDLQAKFAATGQKLEAKVSADLEDARRQIAELKATVASREKQVRSLTQERDDLRTKLAAASRKNPPAENSGAELAALKAELERLRSRVAVDEAAAVPFTAEELALFRQPVPQPAKIEPSPKASAEIRAATTELAASAQRHFSNQEYDQAEADYRKILEHDQNNGLALANLATIELQANKLELAEQHIRAALAQSPDDAYNLSTLGYLKFRQEKFDEALDILNRAAKLDPNNPEILNYLSGVLGQKGLRQQAESALRRAITINPNYAPAHHNLAVIYLSQTPPVPALARWHYQKTLEAGQPRDPALEKKLAKEGAPVAP